jgi:hypothetical protein
LACAVYTRLAGWAGGARGNLSDLFLFFLLLFLLSFRVNLTGEQAGTDAKSSRRTQDAPARDEAR